MNTENNQLEASWTALAEQTKKGSSWIRENLSVFKKTAHRASTSIQEAKTDLFEAMKPERFAVMVIGFAKLVAMKNHSSSSIAINRLAKLVSQDRLAAFTEQDLANLVHGLSLVGNKDNFEPVLEAIDQCILHLFSQRNLANFEMQQLATLVRGLRQVIESSHCWEILGKELAESATIFSQNYQDFTLQEQIGLVVNHIAVYILQRNLANVKPQLLAELFCYLSQAIENLNSDCNPVLKAINDIAVQLSQYDLAGFEADLLDRLACGFRKLAISPDGQPAHEDVVYTAEPDSTYNSANLRPGQRVSRLIDSIARFSQCSPANDGPLQRTVIIIKAIANYFLQCDPADFELEQLANLLHTFTQLAGETELDCNCVLDATDSITIHILQHDLTKFKKQLLINFCYKFHGMLGELNSKGGCDAVVGAAENLYEPGLEDKFTKLKPQKLLPLAYNLIARYIFRRNLANLKPQQLIDLVNGLYKIPEEFRYKLTICALDQVVVQLSQCDWSNFKPLQLAELAEILLNVVNSLAPDQPVPEAISHTANPEHPLTDPEPQQLSDQVSNYVALYILRRNLACFGLQQLANLVNGFRKRFEKPGGEEMIAVMDYVMMHLLQRNLADFDRKALANLANEIGKLSLGSISSHRQPLPNSLDDLTQSEYPLINPIARYILQRDLTTLKPQQLLKLAQTFSQTAGSGNFDCQLVLDRIVEQLAQRDLTSFGQQSLISLIHSFRKAAGNPNFDWKFRIRLVDNVAELGTKDGLVKLAPEALANLVRYNFAAYILQRDLANFEVKSLVHLMNEFCKVLENPYHPLVIGALDQIAIHLLQRDLTSIDDPILVDLVHSFWKVVRILSSNKLPEAIESSAKPTLRGNLVKFELQQRVVNHIARYISQRELANFELQQLVNLIIGFGRHLEKSDHQPVLEAMDQLTMHLLQRNLQDFRGQTPTYSVNVFNKKAIRSADPLEMLEAMESDASPILESDSLTYLVHGFNGMLKTLGYIADHECISPGDLADFDPQQLANLAIKHIAAYVSRRNLASFSPQQLANLVYVFSQLVEKFYCQHSIRAINRIADYISRHGVKIIEPLSLVNLIHGLSKLIELPDFDCKYVLNALSITTKHILGLTKQALEWFKPQQLANLINELSRMFKRAANQELLAAVNHIANYIGTIPKSRLKNFDGQTLDNLLHGLGEVIKIAPSHKLLAAVDPIANYLKTLLDPYLTAFDPKLLASLVHGLSKVAGVPGCKEVLKTLNYIAKQISKNNLKISEPLLLINLVNGLNKIVSIPGFNCKYVFSALKITVWNILELNGHNWGNFKPQQLANLVNGLSKLLEKIYSSSKGDKDALGVKDVCTAVDHIAGRVSHLLKEINEPLKKSELIPKKYSLVDFCGQTLANLSCGLSKANKPEYRCKHVIEALSYLYEHILQRNLVEFESQQLARIVNCDYMLGKLETTAQYILCSRSPADWVNFKPRQLANLVCAFSKVGKKDSNRDILIKAIDYIAGYLGPILKEINESLKEEEAELISEKYGLVDFCGQTLANLSCGLSEVIEPEYGCTHLFETLGHVVKHLLQRNLGKFEPQQLAWIVKGLRSVSDRFGDQNILAALAHITQGASKNGEVAGLVQKLAAWGSQDGHIDSSVIFQTYKPSDPLVFTHYI